MQIEFMIYLYGAVCVSMIGFNLVYALILRSSEPRLSRRSGRLQAETDCQLDRLCRGEDVEERHLRRLQRRLCRLRNLIAFERVLHSLYERRREPCSQAYLTQLQPCALYLALVYQKRDDTQAAYFSYLLARYMIQSHMPIQTLQQVLLHYLARDNLYCRVNALQALYSFGSTEYVLTALKLQDQGSVPLHEKVLTEGLLSFTGDHSRLSALLWKQLDTFSPHTQLAILNYIRFQSGTYTREMLALMQDTARNKELRLAAIRYFGRYSYPPALPALLAFAQERDPLQWEYATVSASSLARYQSPQVLDALKKALHSSNWYVRYAAAVSLETQQARYEDLLDIAAGSDRYAREMMIYRLEARRMKQAGGTQT